MATYIETASGKRYQVNTDAQTAKQRIENAGSGDDFRVVAAFSSDAPLQGYSSIDVNSPQFNPPTQTGPANPYAIVGSSPARVEEEKQRFLAAGGDPSRIVTDIGPITQPDGTVTRPVSDTAPFPGQQKPPIAQPPQQTQALSASGANTGQPMGGQPIVAPAPPATPLPTFGQKNLTIGSRGAEVSQLQQFLASQGFNPGPIDGIFGPLTQSAVKQYQQRAGLNPDGIVGPNTKGSIGGSQPTQTPLVGAPGRQGGGSTSPTGTITDPAAPPVNITSRFEKIYSDALAENGVSFMRSELTKFKEEIEKIDEELSNKLQAVNDNPWISEALKSKQIIQLQERYERKKETRMAMQTILQGEIDRAIADARFRTTGEIEEVNNALDRAEKQQEALQKLNPPFELSAGQTRFVFDSKTGKYKAIASVAAKEPAPQDAGRVLSVTEAQALGVPFGTTAGAVYGKTPLKPQSGDAAKVSSIAETILPELEELKNAFRTNYRASVTGIVTGTDRRLSKLVDNVADKLGRLRSGGAVNKDEEARFKRQIASFADIAFGNQDDAVSALEGIALEARNVLQGIQPSIQNNQPQQFRLPDGRIVNLQPDGTYK